ncbi:MAG: MerR family transcriptional regulator [Chloroflexota bacterium]|nr:MerR family transcriptional regulator [Chloroflexota bacterium]
MPTEAPTEIPTKAKREIWNDWLPGEPSPEAQLLTLPDLLQRLRDQGVKIHTHDIRHWQAEGVLPYPVKRWHNGATRALYPEEAVDVIRYLRQLQADGYSLAESRWRLRMAAQLLRETGKPLEEIDVDQVVLLTQEAARLLTAATEPARRAAVSIQAATEPLRRSMEAVQDFARSYQEQIQKTVQAIVLAREGLITERVHPHLQDAAHEFSDFIEGNVARVDVTFVDNHDQHHTLSVHVPPRSE